MLEQEYIDLCNELKTKYDNLQKEKDKLTQERERIIRVLTILYGLIRMLKTIINNTISKNSYYNAPIIVTPYIKAIMIS